jgi:hypothetical protein
MLSFQEAHAACTKVALVTAYRRSAEDPEMGTRFGNNLLRKRSHLAAKCLLGALAVLRFVQSTCTLYAVHSRTNNDQSTHNIRRRTINGSGNTHVPVLRRTKPHGSRGGVSNVPFRMRYIWRT